MAEIKLVAFCSSAPAAGSSLRIVESHGVQRWTYAMIREAGDEIGDAALVMRATLEAETLAPGGASPSCAFIQLGTPTAAIEEAFDRTMRQVDMARAMQLPGALSARRYRLEPMIGRCDWETLTLFGFAGDDTEALTAALVDSSDVWEGDPSCIVMRVVPAHEGAQA